MSKRSALRSVATHLPIGILPIDGLLRFVQRIASAIAGLSFIRDWQLEARGRPQFFKHEVDLSRWRFEPSRWSFSARGVYAREGMFKGCRVLDLCCGDGSYSFLFFSDIAGRIDAVDNDAQAMAYARRYHAAPCIAYHRVDIVAQPLPAADYDFVVWNAAICYFSEPEIRLILTKIIAAGRKSMALHGMLPKANGWIDHKTEFADCAAVERFLREFFAQVAMREVDEGNAVTFYFAASEPLQIRDPGP